MSFCKVYVRGGQVEVFDPLFVKILWVVNQSNFARTPPQAFACPLADSFRLDRSVRFLNHGSFGAVPTPVRAAQLAILDEIEAQPVEMLVRKLPGRLAAVRERLAAFLGTRPERLGLMTNASTGVGSVLRSIEWRRGDQIVVSNHGYNAVRQAVQAQSERFGCELVVVDIPLPIGAAEDARSRFRDAINRRTRLVIVDHITSPTALRLPVDEIAADCRAAGVLCLVDGAHAPGVLDLDIDRIDCDWYTGNLHKWVCAPRGCAFLAANPRVLSWTHPETTSHQHGQGLALEADWQGTRDFSAWLSIPAALDFIASGGPAASSLARRNIALVRWAHEMLCEAWRVEPLSPLDGSMLGSMATVTAPAGIRDAFACASDFQAHLWGTHRIEVPVIDWGGRWHLRISAQAYNTPNDYLVLAGAVCASAGGDIGGAVAAAPTPPAAAARAC